MDMESLPNRTLEMLKQPGAKMVSTLLARLLDIDGKKASMLLADLKIAYPEVVKRNRLYNTKEGQSRWEYYMDQQHHVHSPELWRDDGLLEMLTALDHNARTRVQQAHDGDRSNLH